MKLDQDLFDDLRIVLISLTGSETAAARHIGISAQTFKSWRTKPPRMRHWNLVLNEVIKDVLAKTIPPRKSSNKYEQYYRALDILRKHNRTPKHDYEVPTKLPASTRHLARLLSREGMYWDEIRRPAHSGGFSQTSLRMAAEQLGVVKYQHGYGENKRSFWVWPETSDE